MLRFLPIIHQCQLKAVGWAVFAPWRPVAFAQSSSLHTCGLHIIKKNTDFPRLSCSVCVSYSSELGIILQANMQPDKSYTLTSNMLQKSCIMNGGEKRTAMDGDFSPSTYTLVVSVYQCQWAAERFCMLLMSRLQETVPLCFSQFLAILVTFFSP